MREADLVLASELRKRYNIPEKIPRGYWQKEENRPVFEALAEFDMPVIAAVTGLSVGRIRGIFRKHKIARCKLTGRFDAEDITTIEKLAEALNTAPASEAKSIWISYLAEINARRQARGIGLATQASVRCFVQRLNVQRKAAGKAELKLHALKPKTVSAQEEGAEALTEIQAALPADQLEALLGLPDLPSDLELQKEAPRTSPDKPFQISVKDDRHAKIFVINSPGIGTIADTMHKGKDPLTNALKLAQTLSADAVLLTGNLIQIDWLRYSNLRPYRAKLSGIQPKEGITHHPKSVEAESGTVAERVSSGRVAFVTFKQKFDYVLSLVKDMCFEDGKPIFSGPIYISFGSVEEALAMWHANEKVAIDVEAERQYASEMISALRVELRQLQKADGYDPLEGKAIQKQLLDFVIYRKLFVKMTNVIDSYTNLVSDAMRNYMIRAIEASIPNATVVSVGDTYFEVPHRIRGPWLIQVAYEKSADSITGDFAGRLREAMRERTKRDSLPPDIVLGGGYNPKTEYLRVSYRTRGGDEEHEDMRLVRIIQLPTLLDSEKFREVAATFVQSKDRLTKLASRDEFMAGAFFLEIIDGFDRSSVYLDSYLNNPDFFEGESANGVQDKLAASVSTQNLLYNFLDGDNHAGARFSAYYVLHDAKDGRHVLFHDQVVYRFFLEFNVPIVSMSNTGDTFHWKNYPTEAEVHPDYLPYDKLMAVIQRIQSDHSLTEEKKSRRIAVLVQKNSIFAGLLDPEEQFDLYMRRLRPEGIKFISQMLQYGTSIGYTTFGEIGRVTFVHGNHNEHSFSKEQGLLLTESGLVARALVRDLKIYRPGLFGIVGSKYLNPAVEDQLEKFVLAPRLGTLGMGTGLAGIVDDPEVQNMNREEARRQNRFYLYGRYIRHKQATSKRRSNMKAMQRAFDARGSVEADFVGRFVINEAGDDHQGGFIIARGTLHIKNGGQLFRGDFGERYDFGLANILSMVWAVPKDGPHTGPIVVIPLGYEDLRPWLAQRYPVNAQALFAHAVPARNSKIDNNKHGAAPETSVNPPSS
jgi:hypothetical protein